MSIIIPTGAIFLFAGFLQGLTGFGAGLLAMPLLCLFLDIKTAVPLCVLNSIIITLYLIFQLNSHIHLSKTLPLCIAALPGIFIGSTFLRSLDNSVMAILLGILLITYSVFSLTFTPKPKRLPPVYAYIAGFFSGAIGAAFGAGGPPTIIYTTLNNWSTHEIKATLTTFFAFNSVITSFVHLATGLTTPFALRLVLISGPAVLIGTILGSLLFNRLPREMYIKVVFFFLILMGITMLFSHEYDVR